MLLCKCVLNVGGSVIVLVSPEYCEQNVVLNVDCVGGKS